MAVIKIVNFTGEVPRLAARALGENAQEASNLLATAAEFRPLAEDAVRDTLAVAKANAKTLHVFPDETYIALPGDYNSVRTQLNDDQTERTYFSDNTGATAPFEADAIGSILRPLGVPAPTAAPVLTRHVRRRFTEAQGALWVRGDLTAQVLRGIDPSDTADADNNYAFERLPLAGGNRGGTPTGDGALVFSVPKAAARLFGNSTESTVSIYALPRWATITSVGALASAIANIDSPLPYTSDAQTAPEKVFKFGVPGQMAAQIADIWSPNGPSIKAERAALDRVISEFATGIASIPVIDEDLQAVEIPLSPVMPNKPVYFTPEGQENAVMDPDWVTYYSGNQTYTVNIEQSRIDRAEYDKQLTAKVDALKSLQKEARALVDRIEAEFNDRRERRWQLVGDIVQRFVDTMVQQKDIVWDAEAVRETRYYCYTYVTDRGEESAPSPVSEGLDLDIGDTVRIQWTQPLNAAAHNIAYVRFYRSNAGTQGAEFQLLPYYQSQSYANRKWNRTSLNDMGKPLLELTQVVPQPPIAAVFYEDTQVASDLQEVLPSTGWAVPPFITKAGVTRYIKGFVNMPGGVIAGFLDNFVAFCEPYKPYAWPVEYQITVDAPIVGLGVMGQSLIVGTQSSVYIISGADPSTMSAQKIAANQACVSLRSMMGMGGAVLFASPDGLCMASDRGVEVITSALFSREEWQALTPASIIAGQLDGVYYFTYSGNGGGTYALDFQARKLTRVDFRPTAYASAPRTDALFYVQGTAVKKAFISGKKVGRWKSALITMPAYTGFGWVQVDGDQSLAAPITVSWFGDGALRHTATFTNTQPQRLPFGRYLEHELVIEGKARVSKVLMASSTQELQSA